ncbi:hypothetical protein GH741_02185 [Aquibacillus halophilus]|uniref:Uncharacterized protein n=1 Tax=Aquibacillus halophilus TaxID=930132 RepID=A0A6A8D885_9BACI|nr:hypothetical protein [Aquibacillus halophilus]MRH41480.1 hypothetical protein [Aquibacillus halophilus]
MVAYGKELFLDNVNQLTTIIVSLALAICAQKIAGDIANMSLISFIMDGGYSLMSTSEHFSMFRNVLLPFIMYLLACSFLLWMGITNLATYDEKGDQSVMFLKILLGFFQLMLFGLIFVGAKLFSYFLLLVFTVIILIEILNYASSFDEMRRET